MSQPTTTAPTSLTQDVLDVARASHVAVGTSDRWGENCVAWVESKGAPCRKARHEGYLCKRHNTVAANRQEKAHAQRKARIEQRRKKQEDALALHGDQWRERLDRVNEEIERRTGAVADDTAATRGHVHPSIRKKMVAKFSDSNVARVGELFKMKEELEAKLGI